MTALIVIVAVIVVAIVAGLVEQRLAARRTAQEKTMGKWDCPHCGADAPPPAQTCPSCGQGVSGAALLSENVNPVKVSPTGVVTPRDGLYCKACGNVGHPKTHTRGSFWIEVVLWICLIIPGVCYSLWRLTSRQKVCRYCKSPDLIPVNSPIAQAALSQLAKR
jgi:ribosomal protein L40E